MGKVIRAEASRGSGVGEIALRAKPDFDPSKPLTNVKHERFCWAIVQGHRLAPAYEIAGFEGKSSRLPWQLRHKPVVDARVSWLLAQRIEADTRARHRNEKPIADARLRLIRELEKVAYSDVRDLVAWDKEPIFDADGAVTGYRDCMTVTPSHRLKSGVAATIKSVTTKSGALKFDVHDKLNALMQLGKILGLYTDAASAGATTNVQVNQVNVGSDNALEAVRRLAFAIHKAQHSQLLTESAVASHAVGADAKG
jgi:hypothetical protein